MKTIYTSLPIYDKVAKQCHERARKALQVSDPPVPIICPLHRLPSFQWLDNGDGASSVTKVETVNNAGSATDITAKFTLPIMIDVTATATDFYFSYAGNTLLSNLTEGIYYLKITMDTADIYYSDWFQVTCVYADSGLPPAATYSEKYLIINYTNSCDLGNIFYPSGFTQTLWLRSETMENTYPLEERGVENGQGKFIRTFARQTKKYNVKTKELPDFMVEVFNRLKLHDTVTVTDLVGDTNTVYNLEVEHEWLGDDKYYAKIELTFDYDESIVIGGCCG